MAEPLSPLQATAVALNDALDELGGEGAIIGGFALSLLSEPRFTQDVDAVVWMGEGGFAPILAAFERQNFRSRAEDPLEFVRTHRLLPLIHAEHGVGADVALGALPFEREMIRRALTVRVGGVNLRVACPEDLVVMKAVSGRPKDRADIASLLVAHPRMDHEAILRQVAEFAEVLEIPEMIGDLRSLLDRR